MATLAFNPHHIPEMTEKNAITQLISFSTHRSVNDVFTLIAALFFFPPYITQCFNLYIVFVCLY